MFSAITLEMSLKPFKKTDNESIRAVARTVLTTWQPLLKNRRTISFMLWVGDGSEILDYTGDLNRPFEWAYFVGTANLPMLEKGADPARSLHERKQLYTENPPVMTYGKLKRIVEILKAEGKTAFPDSEIRVGETFDIGPEFAVSTFKYKRHPEITTGTSGVDGCGFVDSTALLHADRYPYAAYKNGIPEDTPFASFLGAQTKAFFRDLGFDFLWLSNGLGFSADPWLTTGKIFDGERFYPERLPDASRKVFDFWRLFRETCPDIPIETRGTNNTAGVDYATDGVALYDVYRGDFNITPPPNSPWSALTDDYGLELAGHLSRIAELPGDDILFRYYIHDPWWMNSPWYDRYDGAATDIYLPMALSRINKKGRVQSATRMNILSIDNARGNMPDACVYEPLPHILKAEKHAPDEIPLTVWLYPLREYTTASDEKTLRAMHTGDLFIASAINKGFPLSCVVSTDIFKALPPSVFDGRIIVAPTAGDADLTMHLAAFAEAGGGVILYGDAAALAASPVTGVHTVKIDTSGDASAMREALATFGYTVRFDTRPGCIKPPAWNMKRQNNGTFFSVYNPNTTTDTCLSFPLGAPILLGGETELRDDGAIYRFSRCEHRECRIFVRQDGGVISAHEEAPGNAKYRRRFRIGGLCDATVYYFPEAYAADFCAVTSESLDRTPIYDTAWTPYEDPVFGKGFVGKHKNGSLAFCMPFKKYL